MTMLDRDFPMMQNEYDRGYAQLLLQTVLNGDPRPSRVGNVVGGFGAVLPVPSMSTGKFPLLTTRRMHIRGIAGELAAFLRGAEDLATFKRFGCNYWDANAAAWDVNQGKPIEEHMVGKIYGAQWRNFQGVDQIKRLVHSLKTDPFGRRHLLTTYDPSSLGDSCLPPCHLLAQFYVRDGVLQQIVTMRSVDLCVGLPTDVALYALLQILVAKAVDLRPGALFMQLGDAHVYEQHLDTLLVQLQRVGSLLPTYNLSDDATLDNFEPGHLDIIDYEPEPSLNYALLV